MSENVVAAVAAESPVWGTVVHHKTKPKNASAFFEEFPGCQLTPEQVQFGMAMDRYKRERCRPFPTYAEVLAVAKGLGYAKQDHPAAVAR